ncbi:MAG: hypothetical protein LH478_04430 [Chitinophagaceae bacterium]|nr:hypothetical protein [Chitinophagaceae bacterium]
MGQLKTQEELTRAIAELERKKTVQLLEMKSGLEQVKHAMKPVNLVRNTFSRFAEIPEVRRTLISTVVGFGMGYVAKKAKDVLSEESMDNLVSTLVHTQMSKLEDKNPDSFLTRAVTYFRKNLKEESPLYPFIGYRK